MRTRTLTICGHPWRVTWTRSWIVNKLGERVWGETEFTHRRIRIWRLRRRDVRMLELETRLHEFVHVIEPRMSEVRVARLARELTMALWQTGREGSWTR